jgi:hypothetical protein
LWVSPHQLIHLDTDDFDEIIIAGLFGNWSAAALMPNVPEYGTWSVNAEPSFGLTAPLLFLPFHAAPVRYEYANIPHCVAVVLHGRQLVERIATGRALKGGEPRRRRHGSVVSARVRSIGRRIRHIRRRVVVNHERISSTGGGDEDASFIPLALVRKRGRDIGVTTDRGMHNVWVNAGNRADLHVHGRAIRRDRHSFGRNSVRAVSRAQTCTRAA